MDDNERVIIIGFFSFAPERIKPKIREEKVCPRDATKVRAP